LKNNTIAQKITDAQHKKIVEDEIQNKASIANRVAAAANRRLHGRALPQATNQITPEDLATKASEMTTADKIANAANRHLANKKLVKNKTAATSTEQSLADRIAAAANRGRR
jgi:hypothetical protein